MLRKISIVSRIMLLFGASLLLLVGLVFSMVQLSRNVANMGIEEVGDVFFESQKQRIRDLSTTMSASIGEQIKDIKDIKTRDSIIAAAIKNARYEHDKSGYFFVYDGGLVVAHVFPDLVGKDLGNATDSTGLRFNAELAKKAAAGGGFVTFEFNKPGGSKQVKIAYGSQVPNTSLWVGAGVYLDNVAVVKEKIAKDFTSAVNKNLYTILLTLGLVILGIYVPLGIFIARSIMLPVKKATHLAEEIAKGNLDVRTDDTGTDEAASLQKSMVAMAANIKKALEQSGEKTKEAEEHSKKAMDAVRQAEEATERAKNARREGMLAAAGQLEEIVGAMSAASTQLSAQIEQSDRGSSEQASRVSETATAVEEMNSTVLEVARNAGTAAEASAQTKNLAEEGAKVVQQAMGAISDVQKNSSSLREDMTKLSGHAQAITQVMGVISDIADQTNLLALNAAIEAARAGEAGRGFAVVADEVRKLAEKTMASTAEVGNAIRTIQQSTSESVKQMDATLGDVERATSLAGQCGDALHKILAMADSTADQVRAIATASEEQSASSEEIAQSVARINTIATETARAMQEAAQAVSGLAKQSHVLNSVVEQMKRE